MKDLRYSIISLFLGFVSIFLTVWVNLLIAQQFIESDGKTQGLFGIIETTKYYYKYYFILISFLSIAISFIATKRKENKNLNIFAYMIGIFSTVLIFLSLWKLMI